MAKKVTLETLATQLAKMDTRIGKMDARMEERFAQLGTVLEKQGTEIRALTETAAFIVKHMATKDDVREIVRADVPGLIREELKEIRSEVASIRRDLERLTANVANVIGYRKEIDHALERIAAIEQHLGINRKIAA
jgi:hypothetical protein